MVVRSNELYAENGNASLEPSPEKLVPLHHMDPHVRGHMDASVERHGRHCNGWASQGVDGEDPHLAQVARELAAEQTASHALLGKAAGYILYITEHQHPDRAPAAWGRGLHFDRREGQDLHARMGNRRVFPKRGGVQAPGH